jgi:hypothetical protein
LPDAQAEAKGDAQPVQHTRTEPTDRTEPPPPVARETKSDRGGEEPADGPRPPDRQACRRLFASLEGVAPERAERVADHFFDHYAARGWSRGPDRMPYASWHALARTWAHRQQRFDPPTPSPLIRPPDAPASQPARATRPSSAPQPTASERAGRVSAASALAAARDALALLGSGGSA